MQTTHISPRMSQKRSWIWLLALAAAFAAAFAPLPYPTPAPTERHFRLEARTFEFSPAVLRVNPGDRVTIEIVSTDVVHGFYLDGYDVNVTADPGQTAVVNFTAGRAGVFRFRCPVACGQMHPFMTGKLQVGPNLLLARAALLGLLSVMVSLWLLR